LAFRNATVLAVIKDYKTALEKLRKFENLGPPFWRQTLSGASSQRILIFNDMSATVEIYYSRSRKFGVGIVVTGPRSGQTEFYSFTKWSTFVGHKRSCGAYHFRDYNILFLRLGMDCILKVSGLPTSDEIVKVREELLSGSISFSQAADRVAI